MKFQINQERLLSLEILISMLDFNVMQVAGKTGRTHFLG
jgi:hypothetical protein